MLIGILEMPKDYSVVDIAGESSREYRFKWNPKHGIYTYQTDDPVRIHDIFRAQLLYEGFFFIPIVGEDEAKPAHAPEAFYTQMDDDDLRGMLAEAGIQTDTDSRKLLIALTEAYFSVNPGKKEEGKPEVVKLGQEVKDLGATTKDGNPDHGKRLEAAEKIIDSALPEEEEAQRIRARLKELGVDIHPRTGLAKLRAALEDAEAAEGKPSQTGDSGQNELPDLS